MAKLLKILGIVVGALVGLFIVILVGIALTFDPNDYRSDIELAVEESTGRTLTLAGDLELQLFPRLRIAFAHGGGSFPATIGRIEHGFNVRPDLCAADNPVNPRDYLDRIYLDSLVHDRVMLQLLIDRFGADRVALGSDYPFPLGELQPGHLIETTDFLNARVKEQVLSGSALAFLGQDRESFL